MGQETKRSPLPAADTAAPEQHEGRAVVPQLDPYGCGAACVAFVAQMSYEAIALEMTKRTGGNPWTPRGFWCSELAATLRDVGFPTATYRRWDNTTPPGDDVVIIFVTGKKGQPYSEAGHFLVRWRNKWMCSHTRTFVDDAVADVEWVVYPNGVP